MEPIRQFEGAVKQTVAVAEARRRQESPSQHSTEPTSCSPSEATTSLGSAPPPRQPVRPTQTRQHEHFSTIPIFPRRHLPCLSRLQRLSQSLHPPTHPRLSRDPRQQRPKALCHSRDLHRPTRLLRLPHRQIFNIPTLQRGLVTAYHPWLLLLHPPANSTGTRGQARFSTRGGITKTLKLLRLAQKALTHRRQPTRTQRTVPP